MDIQPIYRCAAGIDVHLALLVVCIIIQREANSEPEIHLREFGGFKRDRREMAVWIASFTPDIVVMESTGIYWKSPYAALEKAGIRAMVVNAQHVKKVQGRKTDICDAQWLAMPVLSLSKHWRGAVCCEAVLFHRKSFATCAN